MTRRKGSSVAAALAAAAALAVVAACHEGVGPGACFEPNVLAYGFALNGDTNLVFHWPSAYMPVRIWAEPAGAYPADVQLAMGIWQNAFRCGELSLTTATDSTRADIIALNPLSLPTGGGLGGGGGAGAADSVGACQGVTQYQTDSAGTTLTGPVHLYVAPAPGADSVSVASCYHFVTAHELGHALGILAHSADSSDLMYSTPHRAVLTEADRYTIQLLYHTTSKIGPPPR